MRADFPPPPDSVTETPLHVLVREYPETLRILRAHGVDLAARGAEPITTLPPDLRDRILDEIHTALRWREPHE